MPENLTFATDNFATFPNELRCASWSELAEIGIERTKLDNRLTCRVSLPAGWSVVQTEHPHWQKLLDANGRNRADIYICVDFHCTRAFIAFRRRFTTEVELHDNGAYLCVRAMDGDEVLHRSTWHQYISCEDELFQQGSLNWPAFQAAEADVEGWLAQNLAGWKNCFKHWELEF